MSLLRFELKDLPSKGVFYSNVEYLELRRYSIKDINDMNFEDRSLKELISSFKKDLQGISPDDLLYMDFLYMHLFRTASIYNNSKLKLNINCPHCNKEQLVDIDYTKVELYDFDDYLDLFPLKVQVDDRELAFNLPTLTNIEELISIQEKKFSHDNFQNMKKEDQTKFNKEERLLYKSLEEKEIELMKNGDLELLNYSSKLITYGILSSLDTLETIKIISTSDNTDLMEVLTLLDELSSSAFKTYTTVCSECKEDIKISLEGVATLIRPFCSSTKSIADKIRARRKASSKSKKS